MRREDILAMKPGRELDALVAEKVMGWHRSESWGGAYWQEGIERSSRAQVSTWNPSTEMSAAWEIIEKMSEWDVNILKAGKHCEVSFGSYKTVICKTVPEATCKAAILAAMDV